MTVYTQTSNGESNTMMNLSATGLQRSLLKLLQQGTLKRLSRIVTTWQRSQMRLAVQQWAFASKGEELSVRYRTVKDKIGQSHAVLSDEQAKETADVRRRWNEERERLVDTIGYKQDDHIAIAPDDVHKLRALDKHFREQLNKVQQDHLNSSSILNGHCRDLRKDCDAKLQAMALFSAAKQMQARKERSRAALGRTWQIDDLDTSVLQWAFTDTPDPCMVSFPQSVAMEEQQQALAQTCRLIFEYADKLPRWGQLASINQGRHVSQRPATAATNLLKSILRRVQARTALQPAFQRLLKLPPRTPRDPAMGKAVWKRVGAAIRSEVKKRHDTAQDQLKSKTLPKSRNTQARKSLHITPVVSETPPQHRAPRDRLASAPSRRVAALTSPDDSLAESSVSPSAPDSGMWDAVLQATHRRQSRVSTSSNAPPFMLGDDTSPALGEEMIRRPSFTQHYTPRSRAATEWTPRKKTSISGSQRPSPRNGGAHVEAHHTSHAPSEGMSTSMLTEQHGHLDHSHLDGQLPPEPATVPVERQASEASAPPDVPILHAIASTQPPQLEIDGGMSGAVSSDDDSTSTSGSESPPKA